MKRKRLVKVYTTLDNKELVLLKKTELWGKSGLEQNESSRAYPYLFKTINQSQCLLRQFQEEKIQKG